VSEFDTLEDYKADIRKFLTAQRGSAATRDFNEKLLDIATENMTVDVPEAMVDERVESMINEFKQNLAAQGVTLEQYLGMMGVDAETFFSTARPAATQQVKNQLLLAKIAETENFEVSDEDVDAEYENISKQYGVELDRVKQSMEKELVVEDIKIKMAAECIYSTGVAKAPEAKAEAKTETKPKTTRKKAEAPEDEAKDTSEAKPKAAKSTKAKKESKPDQDAAE